MSSGLPKAADEAIALGAAYAVGEQPSILANLALANTIANANLSQQNAVSNVQAMNSVTLAIVAKAAELIMAPGAQSDAANLIKLVQTIMGEQSCQTDTMDSTFKDILKSAAGGAAPTTSPEATPDDDSADAAPDATAEDTAFDETAEEAPPDLREQLRQVSVTLASLKKQIDANES